MPAPATDRNIRSLTDGETYLVHRAFGDAIDTSGVTIRRAKWWWLQPAWVAMAPDGHIWFHPNHPSWCEDFSAASLWRQGLFIHEMVHVWQHQQGINLIVKRLPFARYDYLPLVPGKPFPRYGIEQQAEIVRDAFIIRMGGTRTGAPSLSVYDALIPFTPDRRAAPAIS